MLPPWLIRLVLALAFAVLPLQGLADTVQVVLCQPQSIGAAGAVQEDHPHDGASARTYGGTHHGHDAAHADHDTAGHAGGDASTSHHTATPDEAAGDYSGHLCCDVVVAGLTVSAPGIGHFDFPALEPVRDVERVSIFLAYPQRPPLA